MRMMPVQSVDRQDDGVFGPDLTPAKPVGLLGSARQEGGGRIHPERLIHDAPDQGQGGQIGHGGRAVAKRRLRLLARQCLNLRRKGTEVQRPRQRQRRRLMACDDEGQKVVAQLIHVHLAPGFRILPRQQQVQKVRHPIVRGRPALVNRGICHPLHLPHRPARKHPSRSRHPSRRSKDIQQRDLRSLPDVILNRPVHAAPVERLTARKGHVRDHLERRRDHLVKGINRPTRGRIKPRRSPLGGPGHHRSQGRDIAMREDRSSGAALPQPLRPLGHEQRIADGGFQNKLGDH